MGRSGIRSSAYLFPHTHTATDAAARCPRAEICRCLAKCDAVWSKFGRYKANLGPNGANQGQTWPNPADVGPGLAQSPIPRSCAKPRGNVSPRGQIYPRSCARPGARKRCSESPEQVPPGLAQDRGINFSRGNSTPRSCARPAPRKGCCETLEKITPVLRKTNGVFFPDTFIPRSCARPGRKTGPIKHGRFDFGLWVAEQTTPRSCARPGSNFPAAMSAKCGLIGLELARF